MSDKLFLQAVIIHKPIEFKDAYFMAQNVINNVRKTFVRETSTSYRFRNIPKTEFIPNSYVSKKINDKMTLVFGKLNEV